MVRDLPLLQNQSTSTMRLGARFVLTLAGRRSCACCRASTRTLTKNGFRTGPASRMTACGSSVLTNRSYEAPAVDFGGVVGMRTGS